MDECVTTIHSFKHGYIRRRVSKNECDNKNVLLVVGCVITGEIPFQEP